MIGKVNGVPIDLAKCGKEVATLCRRHSKTNRIIDLYIQLDDGRLFYWHANTTWADLNREPLSPLIKFNAELPQTRFEEQW